MRLKKSAAEKKETRRKWFAENKQRLAAERRIYYEANKEKLLAYNGAYHNSAEAKTARRKHSADPANIERRRLLARERRARAIEKCRADARRYFQANRDQILAKNRESYRRTRTNILRQKRKYFQQNRDKLAPKRKQWIIENRDKVRAYVRLSDHRRRASMTVNGGYCSTEQAIARADFFGWRCRYCKEALTPATITLDHVIPISRGGTNWPSNIVPCCKSCNSSKQDKPLDVWLRERHFPTGHQYPLYGDPVAQCNCQ